MDIVKGKVVKVYASRGAWSSCVVASDMGEQIKCSGTMPSIVEGMHIKATGYYEDHPTYGLQFKVESAELEAAHTAEYAERYLNSGVIKGCGPAMAKKIVAHFGDETISIIQGNNYMRLTEIDGIGAKIAEKIHKSDAENSAFKKLLGYANITLSKAELLYQAYKEKALEMIEKKPYQIIYDVDGFGFKTVDAIALKNGHKPDSPDRIAAAITYLLTEIGNDGHCCCSIDALEENLNDLIPSVDNETRARILAQEIKNGHVVVEDDDTVYAKRLYDAETSAARNLVEMLYYSSGDVSQRLIDKGIHEVEDEFGFELEPQQKDAVSSALKNRVCIITGGPGTGKTTIVKAIVKSWVSTFPKNTKPEDVILMCAPTGRAARRMSEVTGVYAETVQRILAKQRRENAEKITRKLIIVDECSMLDIVLASSLVRLAREGNNKLVLIGDIDQLPPIGPGSFFRDLVNSPFIPTTTLKLCHRQSGTIAINAKRINDGNSYNTLNFDHPSFQFVHSKKDTARRTVIDQYCKLIDEYGIRDVCAIVPTRKSGRSHTAADDLNVEIRELLNPERPNEPKIKGCNFREGDRVMYTVNDYDKEVFNGDCGIIKKISPENNEILFELDDGRTIELSVNNTANLVLAYAITVHKSQGSEYKGVVIAHNVEHAFMLQRNLLYTAITRAKSQVVLVGEPAAINMAVRKVPSLERQSRLKVRIAQEAVSRSKKKSP